MTASADDRGRARPPEDLPGQGRGDLPDITVVPPTGAIPLTRMAPERRLQRTDRYQRRAEVTAYEELTTTGTVRISFRVTDEQPFGFQPGHFIGIQAEVPGFGLRRSPYCMTSAPDETRTFRLIVRLVPEGPLSYYLTGLDVGEVISFRGPMGRSMVPKEGDQELVLLATGVGIGPLLALLDHILPLGFDGPVGIYWGLRLVEDVCLLSELDGLAATHENVNYRISLSQPPEDWTGLRGRVSESVPPLLETLGDKRFYLVGNGAMIREMADALSDLGVDRTMIHEEVYFNVKHRPDPKVLDDIRRRFVARDLFSPYASQQAGLFVPESMGPPEVGDETPE